MTKNSDAILGALVADAAALGLHWLYDPDRISRVAMRILRAVERAAESSVADRGGKGGGHD